MIFLRYEGFRSYLRLYPVTAVIIAINIIVYLLDTWFVSGHALTERGAMLVYPGSYYSEDELWRYVTSVFLHSGFDHLLFNSFAILVFAPPLERLMGSVRYAFFYLFAGIMGNAFTALFAQEPTLSVGASGAIYGVYGAFLYLALFKKALDEASKKTVYTILAFGVIYSVLIPNINLWAHLGGAVAGFFYIFWYDRILNTRK
ncbi:rhomboid family intramembrane serine protease [Paenibacillus aurantiacus]|uniref:Rhomboid family intramembrane serine protease n=1 Tax=Paenibacillus aurantiacus TaxID=1936118 RepID=A0ABV5KPI6_9BACL